MALPDDLFRLKALLGQTLASLDNGSTATTLPMGLTSEWTNQWGQARSNKKKPHPSSSYRVTGLFRCRGSGTHPYGLRLASGPSRKRGPANLTSRGESQ